ncbi:hypothetical protein GUITHDRAFT_131936 [Guillardia theta CCMP2712]|uniref:Prolyl endopeptidase n=1 Tax=Guillardia theta (strain CCMP2712) TaxID=905079 RepID=L1K3N0_GUITC|nr:hypothetical protein GUITHDRAFT_131936 [Guillardia theta CCMP2712]EKX54968.1 hypothetical protein GUITHDRAFT_131936 [Guillardia theta CCMP2712]|eukprot:XP_005841948.1 hypothetical protein GUITHDRAFT_131936 [Guillardia theta CCMP2712]
MRLLGHFCALRTLRCVASSRFQRRQFNIKSWSQRLAASFHKPLPPPVARRDQSEDPYGWLRHGDMAMIRRHLDRENEYAENFLMKGRHIEQVLLDEMESRVESEHSSPPEKIGSWYYYMRTTDTSAFQIYCRRSVSDPEVEQIVLDQDAISRNVPYLSVPICKVSPCHRYLAYTADMTGNERYLGFVKDIETGEILFKVDNVTSMEWAKDGETILYTQVLQTIIDAREFLALRTMRWQSRLWYKVWRQSLKDPTRREKILEERNSAFYMDVGMTKDMAYITISLNSKTSSEVRILPTSHPWKEPILIEPRREGLEYFVEHMHGALVLVTNDGSEDYKLVQVDPVLPGRANWTDFYVPEDGCRIQDIDVFEDHIAVYERTMRGQRVRILDILRPAGQRAQGLVQRTNSCGFPHLAAPQLSSSFKPIQLGGSEVVQFPVPDCGTAVRPGANCDYAGKTLRVSVSSPLVPWKEFDVSLADRTLSLLQEQVCPGLPAGWQEGYDCKLELAESWDGVQVPMTVIRRKGLPEDGSSPTLAFVYGSYGQCLATEFDVGRISLLERGWAIVLCHVRGGGELGSRWHREGRGMKKLNGFKDLFACMTWIGRRLSRPGLIALHGTSAGGLLVSGYTNLYPGTVGAVVAKVPFVDIGSTMRDEDLSLTVHEYDEWGDMRRTEVADYVDSYCPYRNVSGVRYPPIYLTAALNDTRVGYWEPAKWAAKVRHEGGEGSGPVLLQTAFEGGHFGTGGKTGYLQDQAREAAFLYLALGLKFD